MRGEHHHRGVRHCVGIEQKTPLAMITDLTKPVDVFLEYHEDLEKLMYWKEKHKKAKLLREKHRRIECLKDRLRKVKHK